MSIKAQFDLVILDWAGTMVDFGCCAPVNALLEAFKRHGVTLTEEEVRRDMGKAKADHVSALLQDSRVAGAWKAGRKCGKFLCVTHDEEGVPTTEERMFVEDGGCCGTLGKFVGSFCPKYWFSAWRFCLLKGRVKK